jgi:hypothetical protein
MIIVFGRSRERFQVSGVRFQGTADPPQADRRKDLKREPQNHGKREP